MRHPSRVGRHVAGNEATEQEIPSDQIGNDVTHFNTSSAVGVALAGRGQHDSGKGRKAARHRPVHRLKAFPGGRGTRFLTARESIREIDRRQAHVGAYFS